MEHKIMKLSRGSMVGPWMAIGVGFGVALEYFWTISHWGSAWVRVWESLWVSGFKVWSILVYDLVQNEGGSLSSFLDW